MVNVSAQSCTVIPLSPTTLTATGGELPSGTMNVRIQCGCTERNGGSVNVVRWYDPAGTRLVSAFNTVKFDPNVPHFTRVDVSSNRNVILVIPTFNGSYDGWYTCGRDADDRSALTPPTANVTLTISELMINSYLCVYSSRVGVVIIPGMEQNGTESTGARLFSFSVSSVLNVYYGL